MRLRIHRNALGWLYVAAGRTTAVDDHILIARCGELYYMIRSTDTS